MLGLCSYVNLKNHYPDERHVFTTNQTEHETGSQEDCNEAKSVSR